MSKFNKNQQFTQVYSPIKSEQFPSGTTYEGAPGFARDARSELNLLAITNMVTEETFYEGSKNRDNRFQTLIREVASDTEWLKDFFHWLRNDANMRSASYVGAVEAVKARLELGIHGENRQLIDSVLQRADEPGEVLAYWYENYGRKIPMPIKRGIADAINRLYTEYSLIKYDTDSHAFRFGDVIELVHPRPRIPKNFFDEWTEASTEEIIAFRNKWETHKSHLFRYAIERRQGREFNADRSLVLIHNHKALMDVPVDKRRDLIDDTGRISQSFKNAGMTWENFAGWLQGPMDDKAWEAIIPSMGYMALLRNLRNFDQVGVSDEVAQQVANRISSPEAVKNSRQLPMRFLTAYRNTPSLRWAWALEKAMNFSLDNIPRLSGRTLILVDTSASMDDHFSARTELMRRDVAAMFGIAIASACESHELVSYSASNRYYSGSSTSRTMVFPHKPGESILKSIERWEKNGFFIGRGTETELSLRQHYSGHDRVIIFTDEQAGYGYWGHEEVGSQLPKSVPLYTFNLAGYRYGHTPSGSYNRHTFGGLNDQMFKIIPLIESQQDGNKWPWEINE